MLRGGSWNNTPQNLRAANRNRNTSTNRNNNNGFRLASTPHAGVARCTQRASVQAGVQGGAGMKAGPLACWPNGHARGGCCLG
ncbi:MAG: hypothetical protein V4582_13480 [Pseudomonadota bacterium]